MVLGWGQSNWDNQPQLDRLGELLPELVTGWPRTKLKWICDQMCIRLMQHCFDDLGLQIRVEAATDNFPSRTIAESRDAP